MNKSPIATIVFKDMGEVQLELFTDTPNSTANFVSLAKSKFYDGLTMHRIIPGFVAQGGCPDGTGTGGPGYAIDGEFKSNGFENNHSQVKGTIAWARSMARNSAGSQFYITVGDASFLDDDYAAFGQVINGMEVMDEIAKLGTNSGAPTSEVIIENITIEDFGQDIPQPIKVGE